MKKKKSQLIKLKERIVELEQDLLREERRCGDLALKVTRFEDEQERAAYRFKVQGENEKMQSEKFLEIIRWQINPETTRDPFCFARDRKLEKEMRGL